jgi:hypothetical protein
MAGALLGVASTNFAYFYWYSVVRTLYIIIALLLHDLGDSIHGRFIMFEIIGSHGSVLLFDLSKPALSPWGSAVAGATGAVLANAMVYPLDL